MRRHKKKKPSILLLYPIFILLIIVSITFIMLASSGGLINNGAYEELKIPEVLQTQNAEKAIQVYFKDEDAVKDVNLEEYLIGVVAGEMPATFETEALKAQAVAARTYIINREKANNEESLKLHKGAAICTDPTHCKAYVSLEKTKENWKEQWEANYNKIKKSVDDTKGIIITYNDEPISAVFHSTSSGKTENSEDVWGGSVPYLKSVDSEGEELSPRYTSTVEVTITDFQNKLKQKKSDIQFSQEKEKWVEGIENAESGGVKTIKIGGQTFKGTEIRELFGLRSTHFTLGFQNDKIVFHVTGNGHGVGMSQYGANYAASQGAGYEEILKKYYQGVVLKKAY